MLANADAYVSDTIEGTGHLRITVSPTGVKVDFIRAYLPADTVSGIHHNGEVAFSYTVAASPAGIGNQNLNAQIKVYPNPVSDKLNVILPEVSGHYECFLSDEYGQLVLHSPSGEIDVRNISEGLYFLNIRSDKGEFIRKVFINR